jgi:hypothetical protein
MTKSGTPASAFVGHEELAVWVLSVVSSNIVLTSLVYLTTPYNV